MASKKKDDTKATATVQIKAPRIDALEFRIRGTAPYMQARFSAKSAQAMAVKMAAGSTAKRGNRKARDFEDDCEQAKHVATDGWNGIPAGAFRAAMISACRLVGFKMTLAKLSVYVRAEGFDRVDAVPLIRIYGEPKLDLRHTRNATGVVDLRARPLWLDWSSKPVVEYDADQFTAEDVTNLVWRVGLQVGIGEGRPDSRSSAGMGFGTFRVEEVKGK